MSSLHFQCRHRSGRLNCGLPAGPATIWLCAISNGFSIDSFTMTEDTSPPPAPIPAPKPTPAPIPDLKPTPVPAPIPAPKPVGGAYGGVSAIIPGIIQAEEFDIGGEGVGYSDSTSGNVKNVGGNGWVVAIETFRCCTPCRAVSLRPLQASWRLEYCANQLPRSPRHSSLGQSLRGIYRLVFTFRPRRQHARKQIKRFQWLRSI